MHAMSTGPPPPDAVADVSAILTQLCAWVAELSRGRMAAQRLDPGARVLDRGYLDSVTYVQFLARVEASFGVRIPEHRLGGGLATLGAIAAHVAGERARG